MMEAFDYAISKDIRNNQVVREIDHSRQRELWRWAVVGAVILSLFVYSAWQHFDLLRHGYHMDQMEHARKQEEEINRHLRLQIKALRAPQRISAIATDRGIDDAVDRRRMAPHEGHVAAAGAFGGVARCELGDEPVGRLLGASHDEQPGAAGIETVDDPGPGRVTDTGDVGVPGEQPLHQGALHVAGARVNHEGRRLVDHDHRRVLVDDAELDRRIGDGQRDPWDRRLVDLDPLAFDETDLATGRRNTVDSYAVGGDRRRRMGAADVGDERDDAIEPFAGEC
jgi:hypothetical protein